MKKCESCVCWADLMATNLVGECRRYPPGGDRTAYPILGADCPTCFEYKERAAITPPPAPAFTGKRGSK